MITNRENSGRVFILGAGFSKYLSGNKFPLVTELGTEIVEKLPWVSDYSAPKSFDIERVLTNLDLDIISETSVNIRSQLLFRRRQIVEVLQHRLRVDNIPIDEIKERTEECLKLLQPGDYILTFNWDCLLEKVLTHYDVWKPYDGYGFSLSITQHSEGGRAFNPFFITILKLHGSLNFLPSSYGGRHIEIASTNLAPTEQSQEISSDKVDPIITLPTYVKDFGDEFDLIEIWRDAVEVISKARVLVVIGYSLPRADAMARLLFSFVGTQSKIEHIAIINWTQTECEHIQNELRKLALLPSKSGSYDDVVNWRLFPAEMGSAYELLHATLIDWPINNIAWRIAERKAFPDYLGFIARMNKRTK